MYLRQKDYAIVSFHKSWAKHKKYTVVLRHNDTQRTRILHFGDKRYQHYMDTTPIQVWGHLDHRDNKRRMLYRKRHGKHVHKGQYSPAWFSMNFLW
jgi:hypothetical protein